MTEAYQCDRCGKYSSDTYEKMNIEAWDMENHYPISMEVCPDCFADIKAVVHGDHRLANAEPSTIPDDAERDEDGEAVFPEVEE